jgi:hypothetical protein
MKDPCSETEVQVDGMPSYVPKPFQTIQPNIRGNTPQHMAARGFAQSLGLHPGMALLTIIVDAMLFGGDLATAWFILPLTLAVSFGLGIATFMAQKKWYGDDNESAFIKAFIVAGLTAIPTSLPGFLCIPAGIVGLFRKER